ncbi:MAG TPA: FtsX-like permease family protein, partial [Candidatus Limnocylindria bacterium]|nr:FtsX-like permease family protein [Candidatus Limnocylindria bacterium]
MTGWTLIKRSLRFHWRSHLGVVLGAAIGSAALIGALIVGDSVRESLRERALERIGQTHFAIDSGDRLYVTDLPNRINSAFGPQTKDWISMTRGANGKGNMSHHVVAATALLRVSGTAAKPDATTRANQINLYGVDAKFAPFAGSPLHSGIAPGEVLLNHALASQLRVGIGDEVLFRIRKPEAISAESPVSAGDGSVAVRLKVKAIVADAALGNLSLRANQVPPHNAFVDLTELQTRVNAENRANLLLAGPVQEYSWNDRKPFLSNLGRRFSLKWSWLRSDIVLRTNVLTGSEALPHLQASVQRAINMDDLQLRLRWLPQYSGVEVRSSRIFMEPAVAQVLVEGANLASVNANERPVQVLTYLVNLLGAGTNTTPYSMVSALDSSLLPSDLRADEIVVNQWLADDLQAQPGTEIALTYFAPDQVSQLMERTNRFRVRAIIPMTHPLCDRTLMPDFPGVAKAEHAGDWETSFPLVHKIRPKDDEYWQQYRGTPKAFISLTAGQNIWASRFGNLTAVRVETGLIADEKVAFQKVRQIEAVLRLALSRALGGPFYQHSVGHYPPVVPRISAASMGFEFTATREQALRAASQSQDFGGLFIGFSFFLIIAALILMALLFQFGLEQRMTEIGTLLALGFRATQVRRMFLLEGTALAFIGSLIGVAGGIIYARLMLHGLTTIWRSATNTSALSFHASPVTILTGLISGTLVAVVTIWFVLRKQAKQPARELLAGEVGQTVLTDSSSERALSFFRRLLRWLKKPATIGVLALALAILFVLSDPQNPGAFFGAGAMCLFAGLAGTSWLLRRMVGRIAPRTPLENASAGGARGATRPTASVDSSVLSVRGAARRKSRSVATVALIACGVFLIVSIGAFRLDA